MRDGVASARWRYLHHVLQSSWQQLLQHGQRWTGGATFHFPLKLTVNFFHRNWCLDTSEMNELIAQKTAPRFAEFVHLFCFVKIPVMHL